MRTAVKRRRTRKIDHRRQFVDPQCKQCESEAGVSYALKKTERGKRRVFVTCEACGNHITHLSLSKVPARVRLQVSPQGAAGEMRYRGTPTEFEIQAYLYIELRRMGYDVRGEVTTKDGDCRFDLVVFRDKKPVRIIEVKPTAGARCGNQIAGYELYGIRISLVRGMAEARELIAKAKTKAPGKALPPLVGM